MNPPLHIGLIMQGGAGWMGGAEYIKNLALALAAVDREEPGLCRVSILFAQALEESLLAELSSVAQMVALPTRQRGRLARWMKAGNRALASAARRQRLDFIYPLTYDNEHHLGVTLPLARNLEPARWAGWIPDFQHRHLPEFFSPQEISKRDNGIAALSRDAAVIVFSSRASIADYHRLFPAAQARPALLHFCSAPTAAWFAGNPREVQERYHLPDRFFLISNQFWQHKNHLLAFDALALLAAQGVRAHFVCTGHPADFRDKNFFSTVLQRLHQTGVPSQVSLLGLIPREDQIQLMRRSIAVLQPSKCEGWSTVVEDARLLGKIVVLSDLEVHREQDPPGAYFFSRSSVQNLADALAVVWSSGQAGPDPAREEAARSAAISAQLAFGRRFLELARTEVPHKSPSSSKPTSHAH